MLKWPHRHRVLNESESIVIIIFKHNLPMDIGSELFSFDGAQFNSIQFNFIEIEQNNLQKINSAKAKPNFITPLFHGIQARKACRDEKLSHGNGEGMIGIHKINSIFHFFFGWCNNKITRSTLSNWIIIVCLGTNLYHYTSHISSTNDSLLKRRPFLKQISLKYYSSYYWCMYVFSRLLACFSLSFSFLKDGGLKDQQSWSCHSKPPNPQCRVGPTTKHYQLSQRQIITLLKTLLLFT